MMKGGDSEVGVGVRVLEEEDRGETRSSFM